MRGSREAVESRRRALVGFSTPIDGAGEVTFCGPITALGRLAAMEFFRSTTFPRPAALFAIVGAGWPRPQSFRAPAGIKTLRLTFNDIVIPDSGFPGAIVFDESHRAKILGFVNRLTSETTLVVHCLHGQSRSRAVVAGLRRLRGEDDIDEWIEGEPNEHVYRTMLAVTKHGVVL